jgi:hypothetical protein
MEQVINETGRVEVMRGIRNQDKTEKKNTQQQQQRSKRRAEFYTISTIGIALHKLAT